MPFSHIPKQTSKVLFPPNKTFFLSPFFYLDILFQPLSVNPLLPDVTPSMPLICSSCFWSWLLQLRRRSSELGFQVDEWRMADWQAGEESWGWKD